MTYWYCLKNIDVGHSQDLETGMRRDLEKKEKILVVVAYLLLLL